MSSYMANGVFSLRHLFGNHCWGGIVVIEHLLGPSGSSARLFRSQVLKYRGEYDGELDSVLFQDFGSDGHC